MTTSIEARDFSPDLPNRQANLDTSSSQPKADNSPTCQTCRFYYFCKERDFPQFNHDSSKPTDCPSYEPKPKPRKR